MTVCILNIFNTMIEDYVKESLALFCNRKVYFFKKDVIHIFYVYQKRVVGFVVSLLSHV